jgi:hypothetical protein
MQPFALTSVFFVFVSPREIAVPYRHVRLCGWHVLIFSRHALSCVFTTLSLSQAKFSLFPTFFFLHPRTLYTMVAGIKSSAVRARARAVEHRVKCKSVLRDVANNVPSVARLEWAGRGVDDDTACAVADAIKCARHNLAFLFAFYYSSHVLLSSRHSISLRFCF